MRNRILAGFCTVLALSALCAPSSADAQIRASEAASVAQTIDGTRITLEYSRPSVRGRDLFGALVPWNVVWTPGANWATTMETDRDIRLNGVDVPAGRYSMWMIPRDGAWTLTLNPNAKLFHFQKPDSTAEQIHVSVQPEPAPHKEVLTWSFPAVSGDAAVLAMNWGETRVPVDVVVQPSRPVTLSAEDRAQYLGVYRLEMMKGLGWPDAGRLEVFEDGEMLRGRLPFPIHPGDDLAFDLVPAGPDRFSPGIYHDGKLFTVEAGATFEFDLDAQSASAVRLRGPEGTVFGQGGRAGS
jgi:hypothetical protein